MKQALWHLGLENLAGVGPKRQQALQSLGIYNIDDLLSYFPFRYEDLQEKALTELMDQEKVTLKGKVVSEPTLARFGRQKNRLNFRIIIDHEVIMVTFFNQPYLKSKVEIGIDIAVYGKWDAKRKSLTGMKILATHDDETPQFSSIYSVSKSIRQSTLLGFIKEAYATFGSQIEDLIPEQTRDHYRLMSRQAEIEGMHFPITPEMSVSARRTAIFEEFFVFQMQLHLLRQQERVLTAGNQINFDNGLLKAFIKRLPFELTAAQKKVVNEICVDLRQPVNMNRLLQGDVGSGKTIVAAIVMYAVVTDQKQCALMVPTEILAEQHFISLSKVFEGTDVRIELLTGSTKTAKRNEMLTDLAEGKIDILIGTHALIQPDVQFKQLALAITDEQHRFGVNQRGELRKKGQNIDVLAMTATPIPRTLAITTYGEMDVSTINELPKGRIPIETTWLRGNQSNQAIEFVRKELKKGVQAYFVAPLIEESESLDVKNAQEIHDKVAASFEPEYHVGLLHGRMKPDEKEAVMQAFKNNEIQILVSTTVIEVGVDVPNATTMVIFDADRFGLSQLHQLRGRVGRGKLASYCLLIADPKNDLGIERMKILTETNDGFILAQKDLELRGPGDIFGSKQSGLPDFKVGDPIGDFVILDTARQIASELVVDRNYLDGAEFERLNDFLKTKEHNQGQFD